MAIGGHAGAGAGAGGTGVVTGEEPKGGVGIGGHAIDMGGRGRQVDSGVTAGAGAVRGRVRAREGLVVSHRHVGLVQTGDVVLVDLAEIGAAVAINADQRGSAVPFTPAGGGMAAVGAGLVGVKLGNFAPSGDDGQAAVVVRRQVVGSRGPGPVAVVAVGDGRGADIVIVVSVDLVLIASHRPTGESGAGVHQLAGGRMAVGAASQGVVLPGIEFGIMATVGSAAVGIDEIATDSRRDGIGRQRQVGAAEVEAVVLVQGTTRAGIGRMTGAATRSQR